MNTTLKPIDRTAETFRLWLKRREATTAELLDWCYFGFRRGRDADNPHYELLKALPKDGGAKRAKKTLARRIATALSEHPDLAFPYPGYATAPDFLLYELLSLAELLICPDELLKPLWKVREALLGKNLRALPETRIALTKALLFNQRHHPELLKVWLRMTAGKADSVLMGSPEMGLQGIGMMPGAANPKRPDAAAVGEGLLNLARRYAPDKNTRRQRFRQQVLWLKQLWNLPTVYFIDLAHKYEWCRGKRACNWAVDEVSELLISDQGLQKLGIADALIPRYWVNCQSPSAVIPIRKKLCGGRVLLIGAPLIRPDCQRQYEEVNGRFSAWAKNRFRYSENESTSSITHFCEEAVRTLMKRGENPEAKKVVDDLEEYLGDYGRLRPAQLIVGSRPKARRALPA